MNQRPKPISKALEKRWFEAVASIDHCVLCQVNRRQISHSNQARGKAQKSAPWLTAAICPECHHEIDNGTKLPQLERRELHWRAIGLTHDILIQTGYVGLIAPDFKELRAEMDQLRIDYENLSHSMMERSQ